MIKNFLLALLLLPSASYAQTRIEPSIARNLNSYEFGEFVKMYMPDNKVNDKRGLWEFNADNPNIIWTTNGVEKAYRVHDDAEIYIREGIARINFLGTVPMMLKKRNVELAWDIVYFSDDLPKFGVKEVRIDNVCFGTSHQNCESSPLKSLKKSKISYKKICQNIDLGSRKTAYSLNYMNKKTTYLLQTDTCGSGGCSTFYRIYYNLDKNACKI